MPDTKMPTISARVDDLVRQRVGLAVVERDDRGDAFERVVDGIAGTW